MLKLALAKDYTRFGLIGPDSAGILPSYVLSYLLKNWYQLVLKYITRNFSNKDLASFGRISLIPIWRRSTIDSLSVSLNMIILEPVMCKYTCNGLKIFNGPKRSIIQLSPVVELPLYGLGDHSTSLLLIAEKLLSLMNSKLPFCWVNIYFERIVRTLQMFGRAWYMNYIQKTMMKWKTLLHCFQT